MLTGHSEIITGLKKLASKGGLSHGYIFHGPRMVGKRATALALARFLEKGEFEPPAEGEVLQDAKLIDLEFMKMLYPRVVDSIGIDAVREIKDFLWQKPNMSPRRTLILDDAELLTAEAENALLKITEEPPPSSLLVLIASDIERLAGTVRSRLQGIYFGPVRKAEIVSWLARGAGNIVGKGAGTAGKIPDPAVFAERAFGKPGLAWRLVNDAAFRNTLELAEKYVQTAPAARKDFIKKLIEPDDFNLRKFLDAVILTLAWEKHSKARAALWHKALALQQSATNFSLNPRLQLESLLM